MLDSITKKKIDDARDILVGKVPVPSSQVEQITIALIYKFMYDMDNESIELGGNPKYFSGDFSIYAWNRLFDPKLSGEGRITLYQEALAKIPTNSQIPSLFRDIFKNAFLPYRDPETLKLFLKCIDEFTYDHSEKLGDAFEYLLAILGSQGDAGQFRTPRHIIDFMVELIDPQKEDSILDPACGTAGFLISAFKHIIKTNSSNYDKEHDPHTFATHGTPLDELVIQNGKKYNGDLLTPDQRTYLHKNIKGYDIAFEMVRLSLVNMYLHGFNTPQIYEYDTLSSSERWNEYANVILANPPFMTPKGGIRPHQKFSIQAKRSEVLFVDYMLEHLTNNGRACIIVPDSIISQSGKAYIQLRKLLVEEDFLVGIIYLPAGVFNPYSGVKTAILWIDKSLARKSDKILFLKINNDGYDLGAQRKPIEYNDLPCAFKKVEVFKNSFDNREELLVSDENTFYIDKDKITKNGEYILDAQRYQEAPINKTSYPLILIDKIINTITPPNKIKQTNYQSEGKYPIIDQSQSDVAGWCDDIKSVINVKEPVVVFGDHTCCVKYVDFPFCQGADGIKILKCNSNIMPKYLYYFLKHNPIISEGYKRHFSKLVRLSIPLPPITIQEEIVRSIDLLQDAIIAYRNKIVSIENQISFIINKVWE